MNMGKDNVFLHDVDVPEVVWEKLDAAFLTIQEERENTMRKEQTAEKRKENTGNRSSRRNAENKKTGQRKFAAAAAAAAACIIAAAAISAVKEGRGHSGLGETEFLSDNSSNDISSGIEADADYEDGAIAAAEESFTLAIMGAELEKDRPVQLVSDDSLISEKYAGTWMLESREEGGVSYCINVPFTCQGNNIKNITYSINNGAFQIVQPVGESIIVGGQTYEGELNTGLIGGCDDESIDGVPVRTFETVFYKSFTLDYQKQANEDTWINICNECPDNGELERLIFNNTLENNNLGIQKMLNNTVITCTVNYTDDTSKSADVLVNSCIMTCAEAGAEIKEDANREEIFITFELQ